MSTRYDLCLKEELWLKAKKHLKKVEDIIFEFEYIYPSFEFGVHVSSGFYYHYGMCEEKLFQYLENGYYIEDEWHEKVSIDRFLRKTNNLNTSNINDCKIKSPKNCKEYFVWLRNLIHALK